MLPELMSTNSQQENGMEIFLIRFASMGTVSVGIKGKIKEIVMELPSKTITKGFCRLLVTPPLRNPTLEEA